MLRKDQKSLLHPPVRLQEASALAAAIAAALFSATAAADTSEGPRLEEVMVTASRVERPLSTIPNTVTVVNSVELAAAARHPQRHLDRARQPDPQLLAEPSEDDECRREPARTQAALHDRRRAAIQSAARRRPRRTHHRQLPCIERVEVLHGANAIHGLGASGGIINLITKKPTDTLQQSLRVDSTFQTEDIGESGDYGVAYSISNRFGNADVLASLSLRDSGISYDANGDVIGSDNTQGDTMDSRTLNAFLKTGYDWDEISASS